MFPNPTEEPTSSLGSLEVSIYGLVRQIIALELKEYKSQLGEEAAADEKRREEDMLQDEKQRDLRRIDELLAEIAGVVSEAVAKCDAGYEGNQIGVVNKLFHHANNGKFAPGYHDHMINRIILLVAIIAPKLLKINHHPHGRAAVRDTVEDILTEPHTEETGA